MFCAACGYPHFGAVEIGGNGLPIPGPDCVEAARRTAMDVAVDLRTTNIRLMKALALFELVKTFEDIGGGHEGGN
jgi:hypothetical protein